MNLEELQTTIQVATQPAFRGRLLARGQSRSIIWRDGVLPQGSPAFAASLSYDLLSYGDALLSLGIRLREQGGDEVLARAAFEHAGDAIEAVVAKGVPDDPQRGFLRLLASCSFHLARLSARAFSMLVSTPENGNLSTMEQALALLVLRSLDDLEARIGTWKLDGQAGDETLAAQLDETLDGLDGSEEQDPEDDFDPALEILDKALTDNFYSGLGLFLSALETGESALVEDSKVVLKSGLAECSQFNLVPQWWCYRLAIHLIDDLWNVSFHSILPPSPPAGDDAAWTSLRQLFIASLFRRRRSEIELWPSQIEAAGRAVDERDDLVVSLPTSAGKTRVAELCILRCLSEGKRVVFVTPLRALSAQTETTLQRSFGPLGKKISALYGSTGTSRFEEDAFRVRDIIVATPEKLDFALRNDPSILDDVGLIVLDEGHMIGLGEREVRYEVQIQRLLRRPDADQRRIVCLSAILPDGDQFEDFVEWIRQDEAGDAVMSKWRPTRVRFGEVLWQNDRARLNLRVGDEMPFVPRFFGQKAPTASQRRNLFPHNHQELVLATAWRLAEDGQSVLIYCPERRSVEPLARAIVDLAPRGLVDSVLDVDPAHLSRALAIGREWLGDGHPVLECLQLGVAIHHGALPTPFRKEMERLLRDGVLKITVSSPTLAQGLNLTATTVIMNAITHFRDGAHKLIDTSEFKNVIGRAGRAFVDVEGLVLFPIFDRHDYRSAQWNELIAAVGGHEMESGLVRLVLALLIRLYQALGEPNFDELQEYIVNNAGTWEFPAVDDEDAEKRQQAENRWEFHLSILDTAILSLLGEQDIAAEEIANRLDDILNSSLWQRRLSRRGEETRELLRLALASRAGAIWANTTGSQRRGYFLAGVGLSTGQRLDAISADANALLIEANSAILVKNADRAVEAITRLAEILFEIEPFVPDPFPDNWRQVLEVWLRGQPIAGAGIAVDADILRFVESGLVYKLPWGMEAVRVRAQANADNVGGELGEMTIDDFEVGLAVPAVETGTLNVQAAMLMQAGFSSRIAAIKAIEDTEAEFETSREMRDWLSSEAVQTFAQDPEWPTPESHELWVEFSTGYTPTAKQFWSIRTGELPVAWRDAGYSPEPGTIVRLHFPADENPVVLSAAFEPLGDLQISFSGKPAGVFVTAVGEEPGQLRYTYQGPADIEAVAV